MSKVPRCDDHSQWCVSNPSAQNLPYWVAFVPLVLTIYFTSTSTICTLYLSDRTVSQWPRQQTYIPESKSLRVKPECPRCELLVAETSITCLKEDVYPARSLFLHCSLSINFKVPLSSPYCARQVLELCWKYYIYFVFGIGIIRHHSWQSNSCTWGQLPRLVWAGYWLKIDVYMKEDLQNGVIKIR